MIYLNVVNVLVTVPAVTVMVVVLKVTKVVTYYPITIQVAAAWSTEQRVVRSNPARIYLGRVSKQTPEHHPIYLHT
jgi:hypothetical protein